MRIAPSAASAQPRGEEEAVDTISLSVVIPVFAQDRALLASRQALAKLDCVREIIFVLPRTSKPVPIGAQPHAKIVVLRAPLGRASQLNAGAAAARGSHLLFMHHDTEVAPGAVAALAKALTHEPQRAFAALSEYRALVIGTTSCGPGMCAISSSTPSVSIAKSWTNGFT